MTLLVEYLFCLMLDIAAKAIAKRVTNSQLKIIDIYHLSTLVKICSFMQSVIPNMK